MLLVYLLVAAIVLFVSFLVAEWFFEVANEKGYNDKKYLWICFLLGLPGWLLVVALPDKNIWRAMGGDRTNNSANGESLMADNSVPGRVEGFVSGIMDIPKRK